MRNRTIMAIVISVAAVSSCKNENIRSLDLANLDPATAAGEDFYQYATGGWQKNHPLKPEFSRFGSFDILEENNQIRLNELFKGLDASKEAEGSEARKIADLYAMGLDSVRLNKEGIAPVLPYIQELEGITDAVSFIKESARVARLGVGSLYGIYVSDDLMDSKMNILYIGESGLGLRNRDYYLLPQHESLRKGYRDFIEKIFTLAGYEDGAKRADDAFEVEMTIAVPYWSMVQQRDVQAQYNPLSSAELVKTYPNLHFDKTFEVAGIAPQDKLILGEVSYFKELDKIIAKTDPVKLRHYLQSNFLQEACNCTSDDFYMASFEFFSRQMAGIQEPKPRWKRAMAVPNNALGEAVGKLYVAKYFSGQDKESVLTMVKNLQSSLAQHIIGLEWMSDTTKVKALEKLTAFNVKIGYPDKWKDYSALDIDPSLSYFENFLRVSEWTYNDNLSQLGQSVDKDKWFMSPQTVNAYYNPTSNEICFPAGILQPPFYYPGADDAVNYGAIGVVISHEMTHGFDDQGRLFDKDGNMNNWWTDDDSKAFAERTKVLVDQFNKVEVLPGVFANGSATLGENIADQGGLRIAFTALENILAADNPGMIDGLTPQQRFYLSYAAVWAQNITDEETQKRVLTDVHSRGKDRVNATLKNIGDFYKAFGIKEGDAMWIPENERVIIW